MLKMLDEKMKQENDRWLEEQLALKPEIPDDDFLSRVMDEVETSHAKGLSQRTIILFSTYLAAFVMLIAVTPWSWISTQISVGRTELLSAFTTTADIQTPFISISVIFIISFFAVVLGLEQK